MDKTWVWLVLSAIGLVVLWLLLGGRRATTVTNQAPYGVPVPVTVQVPTISKSCGCSTASNTLKTAVSNYANEIQDQLIKELNDYAKANGALLKVS